MKVQQVIESDTTDLDLSNSHNNYLKYRGRCKELAEKLCATNNELTLVKGWYYCPYINRKEQHWWCEDKNGVITDPSRLQFLSEGLGNYEKYQGTFPCSNCEKEILEKDIKRELCHSKYVFCDRNCYAKFAGL